MAFISLEYLLFLAIVLLSCQLCAYNRRWLVLLIASYAFYCSLGIYYLPAVLFLVSLSSWYFGIAIAQKVDGKTKRNLLIAGITVNLLFLTTLKYLPFFSENLSYLLQFLGIDFATDKMPLFVTIGISYFVFQAIAYLADIYLDILPEEKHFGRFALSLAFFPKLLQGPIERSGDLLPQLKNIKLLPSDTLRTGLLLILWGMFQKVVIADQLGVFVDGVHAAGERPNGGILLLCSYAYALQIYFDFSGYTNIALGTARLFNIHLSQNFNAPYLATSIADFWRRWHITFSRFILDYIFRPLQMSWRGIGIKGTCAALVITFLISGLWHGAAWTFIVWGALHGLAMACSVVYQPYQKKLHKKLKLEKTRLLKGWQIFTTFHLVCFFWIFFRANSLQEAAHYLAGLFSTDTLPSLVTLLTAGTSNWSTILLENPCLVALTLIGLNTFIFKINIEQVSKGIRPFRWGVYYALLFSILLFADNQTLDFIYLKF